MENQSIGRRQFLQVTGTGLGGLLGIGCVTPTRRRNRTPGYKPNTDNVYTGTFGDKDFDTRTFGTEVNGRYIIWARINNSEGIKVGDELLRPNEVFPYVGIDTDKMQMTIDDSREFVEERIKYSMKEGELLVFPRANKKVISTYAQAHMNRQDSENMGFRWNEPTFNLVHLDYTRGLSKSERRELGSDHIRDYGKVRITVDKKGEISLIPDAKIQFDFSRGSRGNAEIIYIAREDEHGPQTFVERKGSLVYDERLPTSSVLIPVQTDLVSEMETLSSLREGESKAYRPAPDKKPLSPEKLGRGRDDPGVIVREKDVPTEITSSTEELDDIRSQILENTRYSGENTEALNKIYDRLRSIESKLPKK